MCNEKYAGNNGKNLFKKLQFTTQAGGVAIFSTFLENKLIM
jgi:hypothetical protein